MRIEADRKIDGAGWESREVTEAVEGTFSKLEIRNIAGPILVEGWSQDYVQVQYIKQARSSKYLEEFEIEIEPRGNLLSCDFPVQISEQRRNKLEGTVGDGSVPFKVKTVSGRITLSQ